MLGLFHKPGRKDPLYPTSVVESRRVLSWLIPSLKLTARTWKWMVGIPVSFWDGLFSGVMSVLGSVSPTHSWHFWVDGVPFWQGGICMDTIVSSLDIILSLWICCAGDVCLPFIMIQWHGPWKYAKPLILKWWAVGYREVTLFLWENVCVCVCVYYFSINLVFFGGVWLWGFGCWMIEAGRSWLRDQDFAHAAAFAEPGALLCMNCPIALIAQLGISFFELLQVGSYKSYCMQLWGSYKWI